MTPFHVLVLLTGFGFLVFLHPNAVALSALLIIALQIWKRIC
jgi:hypothetical protein